MTDGQWIATLAVAVLVAVAVGGGLGRVAAHRAWVDLVGRDPTGLMRAADGAVSLVGSTWPPGHIIEAEAFGRFRYVPAGGPAGELVSWRCMCGDPAAHGVEFLPRARERAELHVAAHRAWGDLVGD